VKFSFQRKAAKLKGTSFSEIERNEKTICIIMKSQYYQQ